MLKGGVASHDVSDPLRSRVLIPKVSTLQYASCVKILGVESFRLEFFANLRIYS